MVHSLVEEIRAALETFEHRESLLDEANFVQRVNALDTIEFRLLERIENVLYEHGYRQDLARLYQRAERLWQRLEAVNGRLFRRYRKRIAAGDAPATELRQLFETYAGCALNESSQDPLGYDCLDVFVDGVFGIDQAPEEIRPLESGMIGYQATPARAILALIEHAHLGADEVFYDLGAGLGRVILLVGLLTEAQARGVEFEPAYCAYAQQRASSLGLSRVSLVNVDARQADYADGTVFFLYTPFTGRMLQQVLDRLHAEARARSITVITYGPCTEHVAPQPWLRTVWWQTFGHDTLAFFASCKPGLD
jgi:hypothetical protein